MKISKLLLGTNNPTKLHQYRQFLQNTPIQTVAPKDVGITTEPEETGKTLEENAILKAKFYYNKSGLPTLADDAGFEIPALDNFPGVHSNRFSGHNRLTDEQITQEILNRMKDLKGEDRNAQMSVVIALIKSENEILTAKGFIRGIVPEKDYEKKQPNFPYRSLLFLPELNKWFYDLTDSEEKKLGYRASALEQIKQYFN